MSYSLSDQVMALAGIFQAAHLVEQLAKTGELPADAYKASIESLFNLSPNSVEDVYGDRFNLATGLKVLAETLGRNSKSLQTDTTRYAVTLMFLEGKLRHRKDLLELIGRRIDQAGHQRQHFSSTHENVIANLAGIYQDTLSTFKQRIQVTGDAQHLQVQANADKIRALLLAGIRSAMLWRQTGGRRWQLLLSRKKLAHAAQQMSQFART